jgi:hypothetical protein
MLIVWSIVFGFLAWAPFVFVIGGTMAAYNWDAARWSRLADRGWYRAWLVGLLFAVVGLIWTAYAFPHLAVL